MSRGPICERIGPHRYRGFSEGIPLSSLGIPNRYTTDAKDNDDMDDAKLDRILCLLEQILKMKGYVEDDGENGVVPVTSEAGRGNVNPLRSRGTDSSSRRRDEAESFERSAGRLHRHNFSVHGDRTGDKRGTMDSDEPALTFDEAVARARRKAHAGYASAKKR